MSILIILCLLLLPVFSQHHTPYGSKAPYSLIGGDIRDFKFPCKPTALYSVHRHGTRNIGENHVKRMNQLIKALKAHYKTNGGPKSELSWILDFEHGHEPDKELVEEGYKELVGQGERFYEAMPHLFAPSLSPSSSSSSSSSSSPSSSSYNVEVGTSSKGRCASSALSYLYGVYQTHYHIHNESRILEKSDMRQHCGSMCHVYHPLTHPNTTSPSLHFHHEEDNLLRYYSACKRYKDKARDKGEWQAESQEYLVGVRMRELVVKLGERLGVEISPHDAVTLHILCAMEVTLPRLMPNSQFCRLFEGNELYITAYYQDLVRYAGKMMQEAVDASCILLQDGIRFLKKGQGVSVKFAHTETIFPLLEHIGYLNEPMKGRNMSLLTRQFFGDITPLASNFFLVAMKCPDTQDTLLQAFLNERPIELPSCGSPCSLDKLTESFPTATCDFVAICQDLFPTNYLIGAGFAVVALGELVRRRLVI